MSDLWAWQRFMKFGAKPNLKRALQLSVGPVLSLILSFWMWFAFYPRTTYGNDLVRRLEFWLPLLLFLFFSALLILLYESKIFAQKNWSKDLLFFITCFVIVVIIPSILNIYYSCIHTEAGLRNFCHPIFFRTYVYLFVIKPEVIVPFFFLFVTTIRYLKWK